MTYFKTGFNILADSKLNDFDSIHLIIFTMVSNILDPTNGHRIVSIFYEEFPTTVHHFDTTKLMTYFKNGFNIHANTKLNDFDSIHLLID